MTTWLKRNRTFVLFLVGLGLFRTAVADWNPIPSGSMRPTLLEGDVVLVDRLAYDLKVPLTDIMVVRLGEPARGDVVTFSSPADGQRMIKRIVGLPGDTVEMRDEVLLVNGLSAVYRDREQVTEVTDTGMAVTAQRSTETLAGHDHRVQFLPGLRAMRSFAPVQVPADSYLVLGDNRDNSADSRYIGFVPRRLLIGHAHRIVASADIRGRWLPRFERFGGRIE